MQKRLLAWLIFCFVAGSLCAQEKADRKIAGWVRDSLTLEPLERAVIKVEGGSVELTTDRNGRFELTGPGSDFSIVVTYAEYESKRQQVKANQSSIIVSLAPGLKAMGEVVVFNDGYSKTIANKATGSYARVTNEQLNNVVETNILDRIKYMANGIQETPGTTRTESSTRMLLVRGLSTMTRNLAVPLIILDNFEYTGDLGNINPNDIEDVVILKDAAASAIWGARAANGVIIINSKRGKFDSHVSVNVVSSISVTEKPDLHKIPSLNTSELIDIEKFLFDRGFFNVHFSLQRSISPSDVAYTLRKLQLGQISQHEADDYIDNLRTIDVRKEYEKYFYRTAVSRQNSISLSGGSRNSNWRISGGWDENVSNLDAKFRRATLTSQLNVKVNSKTDLSVGLIFGESRNERGKPEYGATFNSLGPMPFYTRFADEFGNALSVDYRHGRDFIDTAGRGYLLDWNYYPLTNHQHESDITTNRNISAVIEIKRQIIKGLDLAVSYRQQEEEFKLRRYFGLGSYETRDLINRFAQHDYTNNRVIFAVPIGGILDYGSQSNLSKNIRGQLIYSRIIGINSLRLMAGSEVSENKNDLILDRKYGYDPATLNHIPVNYTTIYRDFPNNSLTYITDNRSVSDGNNRFVSLYANGSFNLRQKYTVSASVRRDASNLFGVSTNNKWKPLWSAGFAWNVSREDFYNLSWLSDLKLRTSIGHQGNMDPSKVAVTTMYFGSINPFTLLTPGTIQDFPNPSLRWEQTSILNTGLDGTVRGDRLKFQIEYFNKNVSDLFATVQMDPSAGVGSATRRNVGKMRTWGIDLQLNIVVINKSFRWETDLIANRVKSITSRYLNKTANGSRYVGPGLYGVEGYDAASYFAYRWGGLDPETGDPLGYINGEFSKDYQTIIAAGTKFEDLKYIGSLYPKWTGSWGHNLGWKGLRLAFRFMGSFGYWFKRPTYTPNDLQARRGHPDYLKRWKEPGDEETTNIPSYRYPINDARETFYANSEVLAERGDHIRLQFLNLSYSINPGDRFKRFIQSARISAVANNLGVIWKATKVPGDPQNNLSTYPPLKSFTISLSATF